MKIAFERSIRNSLYPVIHRKNRGISKDFETECFECHRSSNVAFNFSVDHILLTNIVHDAITRVHFEKVNGGLVPRTIRDPVIYEAKTLFEESSMEEYFDSFDPNETWAPPQKPWLDIHYEKFLDLYPFLYDIRIGPRKMATIFNQLDQISFNLKLKLRFLETQSYQLPDHSSHTKVINRVRAFSTLGKRPSKLFSVQVKDEIRDGRGLKDVLFGIEFDSFFSHAAIQGICLLNIDYVPEEIYTSKLGEYAKRFYIFFLVGKVSKEPLKLKDIVDRLQLTDCRRDQADKSVRSLLAKLKEKGFIKNFEILGKARNRRFGITR